MHELRALADDETLLVQSGKPVAVFRTHPWAPRLLIANSNLIGRLLDGREPFVIVLDMDGIDPTQVPTVRAPVPSGPDLAVVDALFRELIGRGSFGGLVVTELEPPLDVNGISALAVARLVCRVLDAALQVS